MNDRPAPPKNLSARLRLRAAILKHNARLQRLAGQVAAHSRPRPELKPVVTPAEMIALQAERRQVRVEESVRDYIVRIARATRENRDIQLGASPRATMALYQVSQAWAAIQGREYVLPDDVKKVAPSVLCHRMIIASQAQLRGRNAVELVSDIIAAVAVPVES